MSGDKYMDGCMDFAPLCNIADRDTVPWKMCYFPSLKLITQRNKSTGQVETDM